MRCVIRCIPGKENIISDFISRNGINDEPIQILSVALYQVKFTSKEILTKEMKDNDILEMLTYLQSGKEITAENFPRAYQSSVHKLNITDGLLTFDHHGILCIVALETLRGEILTVNHAEWSAGHFGVFKTHRKILQNLWWPGLLNDVKNFISDQLQNMHPNKATKQEKS